MGRRQRNREPATAKIVSATHDGRGIAEGSADAAGANRGFGLFNIRERTGHFGGTLELMTLPKGGSRIALTIPQAGRKTA